MSDDEIPPSFEPGTGRRIGPTSARPIRVSRQDRPAPATPATPGQPSTQPARPTPPRTATARPPAAPIRPPAVAAPAARPVASQPPSGSRTDPAVHATRAMPMAQPRPGAPAHPQSPGGAPPRGPVQPTRPAGGPPSRPGSIHGRGVYRRRRIRLAVILALVILLAWPVGLMIWANGKLEHVEALSGASGTPGTTYLIAGSDSRADGAIEDTVTEGQRTDTIMLLTAPANGTPSLVSLPRDTYVDIPGHGPGKLNAAYAYGGAPLLVQTVEQLTGITVDHYVEVGMGGVISVVDAVGGVELCWDADVNDVDSGMVWTAGCHEVDGTQALAFARMRKSDPTGDIGRGQRQQQVIQAVVAKLKGPSLALPWRQVALASVATDALLTDPGTDIIDLGRMALAFRAATGPGGFRGVPPIADPDYRPGDLGSTVLLDEAGAAVFWQQILDGTLPTQAEQDAAG